VTGKSQSEAKNLLESLVGEESKEETYAFNGDYLPRSVWEVRGFNMEFIIPKLHPSNIEHSDQLGLTYRVPVKNKRTAFTRKTTKTTTASKQCAKLKAKSKQLAIADREDEEPLAIADREDEEPLAIEDGDVGSHHGADSRGRKRARSSSSSSSSTSSSSTSKKAKKKSKKKDKRNKKDKKSKKEKRSKKDTVVTAAERRALDALDKVREKDSAKRLLSLIKAAEVYTNKMPAVLRDLKALVDNENFDEVARVISQPVKWARDRFEGLLALAKATVASGGKNSAAGDLPPWADLVGDITSARKSANLMTSIFATMAKAKEV